jgi:hypothetical protein
MDTLRVFLAELAGGVHDDMLDVIEDAVERRLDHINPSLTAEMLREAQKDNGVDEDGNPLPLVVVFNKNARPKYLYEDQQTATVLKINEKSVQMTLNDPSPRALKRFGNSRRIRCPLSLIDIL